MTHRAVGAWICAGACLAAPALSRAQELGGVVLHGFASQGYLHSSDNRFLAMDTDKGTFAFTEEALNVTAQPVPGLRIGVQLLGRDVGPQGNHRVTVDWALGDYRVQDWFGVRAGKVKMPVGLYNTLRDADMARAEILQPPGVYPLSQRELNNAFNGADVYGTIGLGKGGSLDYEGWAGVIDLDDAYIINRFAAEGGASGLNAFRALRLTGLNYHVDNVDATMDHLYGGALEWRPPVPGLRLRGSGTTTDSNFSVATTYTGFQGQAPISITTRSDTHFKQNLYLFLSAEYQRGGLRLSAEHFLGEDEQQTSLSGLPFPVPAISASRKPVATYGQVTYRVNERLQGSTYYSVAYLDRNDKDGSNEVAAGRPAHRAWHKDFAVTGRFDINSHWLFKAEMHFMDGTFGLSSVENPAGLTQKWQLFTAKTTFYF
jgi:hypothetical protein